MHIIIDEIHYVNVQQENASKKKIPAELGNEI